MCSLLLLKMGDLYYGHRNDLRQNVYVYARMWWLEFLIRLFLDTEQFETNNPVMISITLSNRTWKVPACSGSGLRGSPLNLSHLGLRLGYNNLPVRHLFTSAL